MILRKLKQYNKGAQVSTDFKTLTELGNEINSETDTCGLYDIINDSIIALFTTSEDKIFVHLNNKTIEFDNNTKIGFDEKNSICKLYVEKNGKRENIDYKQDDEPVSTLWYSESYEDVNIGLWIYNVLSSKERINILLRKE